MKSKNKMTPKMSHYLNFSNPMCTYSHVDVCVLIFRYVDTQTLLLYSSQANYFVEFDALSSSQRS